MISKHFKIYLTSQVYHFMDTRISFFNIHVYSLYSTSITRAYNHTTLFLIRGVYFFFQDPFWDEPEDISIGSASAFLQSLSYGLDFEDKLMLTDHRGNDQGSLSVVLTPCTKKGSPLGDDYFVEDPKELLDKGICLILSNDS